MNQARLSPIRPQPGNLLDPQFFVGRRQTTDHALRSLHGGKNLLLCDPRRMGKTFWLHYFAESQDGFESYLIDYEGVDTARGFIERTIEGLGKRADLPERVRKMIATLVGNIDSINLGWVTIKPSMREMPPQDLLRMILGSLEGTGSGKTPIILMDEVPLAIKNIASKEDGDSARALLQTMRYLRQNLRGVRWIVTGSIGFHHVLRTVGATSGDVNDLHPLTLGPLEWQEAEELAQRLLLGVRIGGTAQARLDPAPEVAAELVRLTDGIPFLMHQVMSLVDQAHVARLDAAGMRACWERSIDDPDQHQVFAHFLERLDVYYDPSSLKLARRLLNDCLSPDREPKPVKDLCPDKASQDVLDALINDHYLEYVQQGMACRWRYPALQYIWARRYRIWAAAS
ncbi:hypothetical protein J5X07_08320 [Actinomyces bowdenii]|uniref:hypothetical protein n=1 Tax=Actinomyces bowdenii TaxID=131109 RepID=UPI001ABC8C8A|nr:hypothetical protein [Actinomyces bowdenii]MBO3725030.1 hypothetical protein [Actinomyces bowdenii]